MKFFKKKQVIFFLLLILALGGYFGYKALFKEKNEVSYATAAVEKGTVTVSVSGTGQVAFSDEIDIKPKTSGEIVYLGAEKNQELKAGAVIAQLDSRDAKKSVKDAEIDLAKAELSLKNAEESAGESLAEACEDGLSVLADSYKTLLPLSHDLEAMFSESSYGGDQNDIDYYIRIIRAYDDQYQSDYWQKEAEEKYLDIKNQVKAIQDDYLKLTQNSSCQEIEEAIVKSYDSSKNIREFIRQSYSLIQKYQSLLQEESTISPIASDSTDSQEDILEDYNSSVSSLVNDLSSAKNDLSESKNELLESNLDIETQKLKVEQCLYVLADAKENLSNHYVFVPFDGQIMEVNVEQGDSVSASTALAVFATKQKIAEITLNEIDAAKVKTGQKATVSFDAIDELTVVGEVAEIDNTGTVSQGVVTYNAKIAFDSQDERIKPGMSVSAIIIVDIKQNALSVPNSAIKTQNGLKYVQVMGQDNAVSLQQIETGISSDTNTEVLNGLEEGDKVITQTASGSSSKTNNSVSTDNSMDIMRMMR